MSQVWEIEWLYMYVYRVPLWFRWSVSCLVAQPVIRIDIDIDEPGAVGIWKIQVKSSSLNSNLVNHCVPIAAWGSFQCKRHLDGLVHERCNSSANALEFRLSCSNLSIFPDIGLSIIDIRCLIFIMWFLLLVRWYLYWNSSQLSCPIISKFCIEHDSVTAVLSAKFSNNRITEIGAAVKEDFTRFELQIDFKWISSVATAALDTRENIDGFAHNCGNSIADVVELVQSCAKPSICTLGALLLTWTNFNPSMDK